MNAPRLLALALALALAAPLPARAASALPGVGSVAVDEASGVVTLQIPYRGRNPYRVLWLASPRRLVVDVEGLPGPAKRSLYLGGAVVWQIRSGRFTRGTQRVVFDLAAPADLRTTTNERLGVLQLAVYPRGRAPLGTMAAPAAVAGPAFGSEFEPGAPQAPAAQPQARITPKPVRPTPPPAPPTPTALPSLPPVVPMPTPEPSLPPVPLPTEGPLPEPSFAPPLPAPEPMAPESPAPTTAPPVMMSLTPPVFGQALSFGADLPLSLAELHETGASNSLVDTVIPGARLDWTAMPNPFFGFAASARLMSYTLEDSAYTASGLLSRHRRDDAAFDLSLASRFPLPMGLEVIARPGLALRYMTVSNPVSLDGGEPQDFPLSDYMFSGHWGVGPRLETGLGWRFWGPLALYATAEGGYLFGAMTTPNVASVYPSLLLRYGGGLRADFGTLGLELGWQETSYSLEPGGSQSWGGPTALLRWNY